MESCSTRWVLSICLVLLSLLLLSSSNKHSGAVAVAAQEETVDTPTTCGLWLGPSPIKEANDHGWGHSIFTGRLIKKGQLVLGSGIMDDYRTTTNNDPDNHNHEEDRQFNPNNKYHQEHRDRSEKIFGDLFIPVYDWQALDMGQGPDLGFINYFPDRGFSPGDPDDDNILNRKEKDRLNLENQRLNHENRARRTLEFIDDDPPLYQQLWNGDYYHEQLLESYDSMRVFVPGLSNISPCTQRHFNLEQIQQVTYRDWRDSTRGVDNDNPSLHDTSPPSHQAGSFSYLSNAMFVAARDIQVGEELVVECADNSDRFDPQDYPPVDFQPKEAGGYSICLDDKIEERLADHTPNVCSTTSRNVYGEKTKNEDNNLGGGQRGLFAKKTLEKDTILTSTPMIPLHRQELLMNRTTDSNADDTDTVQRQQLLLNYCYGHPESSLLWLPTASLLHAINHAFSSGSENVVQPNAKLMWHHDEYDEDSHLQQNLTRRQRFHHLELLEMPSLQVVKAQGMGLMMDLVATRRIEKDEEIIIDYGEQWNTKWISHQQEWNVELEKITKLHADEKQQHHLEKEKEHRLQKELQELKKKNPNTPIEKLKVEHHHHQKEIVNAMTVKPLGSYVTASDYNELHGSDWLETITEQHHRHREKHKTKNGWSTQPSKVYPSNIQTACYYEMDWLDDDINADVTAESTTYESWYKQEDQLDHSMSCLLPCLIMERRDYVEGEAKRIRKQAEDDDYDDDDDHMDDDDDDTVSSSSNKKKAYYDSEYKERYTAKLIDNYEENTSIDFDCHLFKRFEYIYEDIPREGIIFVNKPHSTDVWLPKAFREPIGLPLEMVPNIWKDLNPAVSLKAVSAAKEKAKQQEQDGKKGGMRGSGKKKVAATRKDSTGDGSGTQLELFVPPKKVNPYIHPDVLKYMIIDLKPHEEKQYQNTMKRWTPDTTETRRERLQEMEEKTKPGSILGLQEL